MTLDLRDELEKTTSALAPPSDLVSRARTAGQHRLFVRRRRNAIGGVAVVALIGVGIANIPTQWSQTTGPVQTGSAITTPDPSTAMDRAAQARASAALQAMARASRQAQAEQRCQAALALQPHGTNILFVSATTVAAIRTHAGAPAAALAGEPWASLNAGDTAAWCTLQTGGTYKIIAATLGGASITFVTSRQPLGDPGPDGPSIP